MSNVPKCPKKHRRDQITGALVAAAITIGMVWFAVHVGLGSAPQ